MVNANVFFIHLMLYPEDLKNCHRNGIQIHKIIYIHYIIIYIYYRYLSTSIFEHHIPAGLFEVSNPPVDDR